MSWIDVVTNLLKSFHVAPILEALGRRIVIARTHIALPLVILVLGALLAIREVVMK